MAILDADKEGYLRSATNLIQTAGRAARHLNGRSFCMRMSGRRAFRSFWRYPNTGARNKWPTTGSMASPAVGDAGGGGNLSEVTLAGAPRRWRCTGVEQFDVTETLQELGSEMVQAANSLEFEGGAVAGSDPRAEAADGRSELRSQDPTARAVEYGHKGKGAGRGR